MPKIPTFITQGRPTTEAPSVRTGIQVSPTATPAAGLIPFTQSIQDYFIKQRDNNEKLEARKKFTMVLNKGMCCCCQMRSLFIFHQNNLFNQLFFQVKINDFFSWVVRR